MPRFPILAFFIALLSLVLTTACPVGVVGGYEIKGNTVYYHTGMKGLGTRHKFVVEGAHAGSFEILTGNYGRDRNRAYYSGRMMKDSHGPSFELLEGPYAKDRNHIYYFDEVLSERPGEFKVLFRAKNQRGETVFTTDGKFIYSGRKRFFPDKIDVASFERIGSSNYFRDKNRVYSLNREIQGADPATFEVVTRYQQRFTRDRENVYYFGNRVEGVDRESHRILDEVHHRDKSQVFFGSRKISNDPENFTILSKAYSKDSNHAYWRGKLISEDPEGFVIFPSDKSAAYAKDGKSAYWGATTIEEADVESFVGLNDRYAKDKNNVYFGSPTSSKPKLISGADPETFAMVKGDKRIDARDKNGEYYNGRRRRAKNE